MKNSVMLVVAILAVGAARSWGQAPTVRGLPAKGLVALWAGEGNARDIAGANHGKLVGGAIFARGKAGQAFQFDGKDGCIDVPNAKALQITGSQTLAMWIKPQRLGVRQSILHKAFGEEGSLALEPTGELSFMYGMAGRNGPPYFVVTSFGFVKAYGIAAGVIKIHKVAKTAAKAGEWTHIAIVRDMTAARLRWYVNGRQVVDTGTTILGVRESAMSLRIGAGYLEHFRGLIDEVGLWDRPLTAGEIAAVYDYAAGVSSALRKGLVGHWLGDGDTKDAQRKHDGKAAGTVTYTADRHGMAKRAFLFDQSGGYVTVPDSDALDTDATFTISMWVKPKTNRGHLFVKWGTAFADYSLQLSNDGRVEFIVCDVNMRQERLATGEALVADRWAHVAATFDKGVMAIYIDGKRQAAKTSATIKSTSTREYDGDDVSIGGHPSGGAVFGGAIDEPALWNRALSAEEIAQVAKAQSLTRLRSTARPYVDRDILNDRVVLNDGKVLKGVVGNEAYELTTFFGKVKVPAKDVIGLVSAGRQLWLMLADGQALVGLPTAKTVTLTLSGDSQLVIPFARIRQCGYRITAAKPAEPKATGAMLTLRSGQMLALPAGVAPRLLLRTPYATIPLPAAGLVRLQSAEIATGGHRAELADGSTLTGTLASQTLEFKLALGPVATVRREEILHLTGLGKATTLGEATVMIMHNGDRLIGKLASKTLTVRTEFGLARVLSAGVRTATFNPAKPGAVVMKMWDDSTVEGQLAAPALTFTVHSGPTVEVAPAHIASITHSHALPDPETITKVAKLIARLGAESYADREAATKELVRMGKGIVSLLERQRNNPDPEVRQRIEGILEQIAPKKTAPALPPSRPERNGGVILHARLN